MAVRLPIVFLLTALIFITVKYWGIKARQDTCLLSLDRQLKLVKNSDEELEETKDRCERQVAEKDMEIGTVKREKITFERKLSVCEQEKEEIKVEQKQIEKENEEVSRDNESVLKQANDDLSELLEKYSKMKKEYERALASETKLRKERDDLKEERNTLEDELEAAKDKSAEMLNKAKQYKAEMEEAKEEMLKQKEILEIAAKEENKKENNLKPEDDKHFYEKKVIEGNDKELKRDIIDQAVEEAFAKVGANPNDVALPVKNETLKNDNDGGVKLNDDHDSNFQVEEPHIGVENRTAIEKAEKEVGQIEKKEIADDKDIDAIQQIENPALQRGNKTLSEEVIEREDKEEADIDADIEDEVEERDEDADDNPVEESELKGLDPDDETFDDNEFDALIDEEERHDDLE